VSALRAFACAAALAVLAAGCGGVPVAGTDVAAAGAGTDTAAVDERAAALDALRPVGDPAPALPVEVTGTDGVTSTVASVERIAVLQGGIAEVVVSLGLGDAIVARDVSTTIAETEDVPEVTGGHQLDAEALLATRPTVVLADDRSGPVEAIEQVRAAGVPVVRVPEATDLVTMDTRTRAIATALGVPDLGEALVERTAAELAEAAARPSPASAPRVAFLYLRGTAGVYLLGGDGSGADALVERLGAVDVGSEAGLGPFTPLTSEALVAADPDVLLVMEKGLESVGGMAGLREVAGVAQTRAGREGRVVAVEDGLLLAFGPRTPATLLLLDDALRTAMS
jgi:iron complex transport system substrate-binding protein